MPIYVGGVQVFSIYNAGVLIPSVYVAGTKVHPGFVPAITLHPVSQSALTGTNFTMTAGANGSTALGAQWQENNVNIAGANSTTLTHLATINGAAYRCVFTDLYGQVTPTNPATLTVTLPAAPTISIAPINPAILEGTVVAFTATAGGAAPLVYAWQQSPNGLDPWTPVGTNSTAYSHTAVFNDPLGQYIRCLATDVHGQVTGSAASLMTVTLPLSLGFTFPVPNVISQWVGFGGSLVQLDDETRDNTGSILMGGGPNPPATLPFGLYGTLPITLTIGQPYRLEFDRQDEPSNSSALYRWGVSSAPNGANDQGEGEEVPDQGFVGIHFVDFTPTVSTVYVNFEIYGMLVPAEPFAFGTTGANFIRIYIV